MINETLGTAKTATKWAALIPSHETLGMHHLQIQCSAVPSAGTITVRGRQVDATGFAVINGTLEAADLTATGTLTVVFSGFFDALELVATGLSGATYSAYLSSSNPDELPNQGSAGPVGAAGASDHGALTGLSDDDHTQYLLVAGTRALTGNWDAGSFKITAETFASDVVTGTAPLTIASTTKVANLNVDSLDDQSGAYYLDAANFTGTNWTDLTDAGATTLHKHDHGGQDGLADDDHTQYLLVSGTRSMTGDLNFNNAGGPKNMDIADFDPAAHGAIGATETFDFSAANAHTATIDAITTLTFTAPAGPARVQIQFIYSAGSKAITWPATVKWNGGTEPTWTVVAGEQNVAVFWYDGAEYLGMGFTES